jgi:mitochondrial cardiolipin hydrolase
MTRISAWRLPTISLLLTGLFLVQVPHADARFQRRQGGVTVAFDGQCEDLIANQIQSARRELLIAIFIMTSQRLENLVVTAAQRGVTVRVKYDVNQASHRSMQRALTRFEELGIECVPITLRRTGASMHHKFMVIDGLRVITGSYNFTAMAQSANYENCVLIESQQVARDFADIFETIADR